MFNDIITGEVLMYFDITLQPWWETFAFISGWKVTRRFQNEC